MVRINTNCNSENFKNCELCFRDGKDKLMDKLL